MQQVSLDVVEQVNQTLDREKGRGKDLERSVCTILLGKPSQNGGHHVG